MESLKNLYDLSGVLSLVCFFITNEVSKGKALYYVHFMGNNISGFL